jgi:hypothetical protein
MRTKRLVAVLVAALTAVVLVPGVAQAAPPSNDDFDNATPLTLPYAEEVDLTEATAAPDDPDACYPVRSNTAWYSFTSTEDTTLRLDFGGAYLDTAIFTGSRGALELVDGTCSGDGDVRSLTARAGVTYYLKIAAEEWEGRFRFTADTVAQPDNDDFAAAETVGALPFLGHVTLAAATLEPNEPTASCDYNPGSPSVWYSYTPAETEALALDADSWGSHTAVAGVYTGTSLADLTEVECVGYRSVFRAEAGRTLFIQFNAPNAGAEDLVFGLRVAAALQPVLEISPDAPSVYDNVRFDGYSNDPEGYGTSVEELNFGDGTVVHPDQSYAYHQYAEDGDYTVVLAISGLGGRTATTSRVLSVRTHDVAITGFTAPTAARVGATKPLTVDVANTRYDETVTVTLYRGTAAGYEAVGTLTKPVPYDPTHKVRFAFDYTFTTTDLAEGNVVFKAVATATNAREAVPTDNTVIAPATRVRPASTGAKI